MNVKRAAVEDELAWPCCDGSGGDIYIADEPSAWEVDCPDNIQVVGLAVARRERHEGGGIVLEGHAFKIFFVGGV